ncbi:MAG: CBS domain-containing protein [Myxococcales bacterium]|nr:CBS domain-containing protein [Myxococcales bacterium]
MNLETARARDLMSVSPQAISSEASLLEAAQRMNALRIHCLVISDLGPGRGLGIITCKDVVQLLGELDVETLRQLTVAEAMSCPAITVPAELCVADCIRLMRMAGVRTVPVLEGAEPVGVLSFTDVMGAIGNPDR